MHQPEVCQIPDLMLGEPKIDFTAWLEFLYLFHVCILKMLIIF